ncbi:MAG TPA: decaprenylphospho-beta-D-erythro-pentofuranosid-2-ulose 2-reductase [Kribbellaceae bacterium]
MGNIQSILVLGGSSEIGLAIARKYAGRPVRVVLAGRPSERLDAAAEDLRDLGCTVETVGFDAREPLTHAGVIQQVFAGGDIDIAVVAFGLLGDAEKAWTDVGHAVELAETNYTGAVSAGVALGEAMKAQGHGVIVALSSVAGERARRSNFVYGSTKAGMDAFYTGLGEALREYGVRVLVVRPGFVKTRMTEGLEAPPLSVTASEVADAVVAAVRRGAELIWVPMPLRAVMTGLRHLPRPVFRRLPI